MKKETAIVTVTVDLITFNHMRKKAQTTKKKNQTIQRKFGIKKKTAKYLLGAPINETRRYLN